MYRGVDLGRRQKIFVRSLSGQRKFSVVDPQQVDRQTATVESGFQLEPYFIQRDCLHAALFPPRLKSGFSRAGFQGKEPVKAKFVDLARALGSLGVWVRMHYVYPYPHVDDVIPLMADDKILPYLDIPFQHGSPRVLKLMKRPAHAENTLERIHRWREVCPDITLRSTFIVGFPGETEADFVLLLDWLREARLDRVGCFKYSPVEGAAANALPDPVSEEVKQERLARFMAVAAAISTEKLAAKVGKRMRVLVDNVDPDEGAIARSIADAPEIDGVVRIPRPGRAPGRRLGRRPDHRRRCLRPASQDRALLTVLELTHMTRRSLFAVVAVLATALLPPVTAFAQQRAPAVAVPPVTVVANPLAEAIRDRIDHLRYEKQQDVRGARVIADELVAKYYDAQQFQPAWQDAAKLDELVASIEDLRNDGLDPNDYHVEALRSYRLDVRMQSPLTLQDRADLELLATDAFMLGLYHVYLGKVDPVKLSSQWNFSQRPTFSFDEGLQRFSARLAAGEIRAAFDNARPSHAWYQRGRDRLKDYRTIAAAGGWPALADGPTLKPGMSDARVPILRKRLEITKDLPPTPGTVVAVDPDLYDATLEQGVKAFQERHGLAADGAIGPDARSNERARGRAD